MHTPAMEEYLWWLKFYAAMAAFLGSFFGGTFWLLNKMLQRLDKRTEGIIVEVFKEMSKALFGYFNEQLVQRDEKLMLISQRLDGHETRIAEFTRAISWQRNRLSDIAIAGTTLASISLFPSNPPSKRERDRIIDDWRRLIEANQLDKGD